MVGEAPFFVAEDLSTEVWEEILAGLCHGFLFSGRCWGGIFPRRDRGRARRLLPTRNGARMWFDPAPLAVVGEEEEERKRKRDGNPRRSGNVSSRKL